MHFITARNALKWNSFEDFTKTNLCNSLFIFTSRSHGRWFQSKMNSVRLGIERWIAAVAVLTHINFYLEVRGLYCHVIRFAINIYQKRKFDCLNYPKNMLVNEETIFESNKSRKIIPLQSWFILSFLGYFYCWISKAHVPLLLVHACLISGISSEDLFLNSVAWFVSHERM